MAPAGAYKVISERWFLLVTWNANESVTHQGAGWDGEESTARLSKGMGGEESKHVCCFLLWLCVYMDVVASL